MTKKKPKHLQRMRGGRRYILVNGKPVARTNNDWIFGGKSNLPKK